MLHNSQKDFIRRHIGPSKINEDPEESAWFFKLKIKDKSEMDSLMSKEEYEKFAKETST